MKIREIRAAGLRGETPAGGWSHELQPEDCVHTLVVVHTDTGLIGVGSVFTSEALVQGAMTNESLHRSGGRPPCAVAADSVACCRLTA